LLEASIDGARGVLLMIAGGSDLGLFEVNEAADVITKAAHPDANIIFGAVIDDSLGDEVKVTVIAAGFDKWSGPMEQEGTFVRDVEGHAQVTPISPVYADDEDDEDVDEVFRPVGSTGHEPGDEPTPRRDPVVIDADDDLDIPSFLR
jgi:cell division protein FtsZ